MAGPGVTEGQPVDLSYPLSRDSAQFPVYDPVEVNRRFEIRHNGFFCQRWAFDEHVGTHVDAPAHFAPQGQTADRIDVADLILPAVVLDVRERVRADDDATVGPDDLRRWQAAHGELPSRCALLALTGWDARSDSSHRYLNPDSTGVLHTPGFSAELADLLVESHPEVLAIGLDAPSLDIGATTEFPVHKRWLQNGGYGVENLTRLDRMRPSGGTVFVGLPAWVGGSGGPARVIALPGPRAGGTDA